MHICLKFQERKYFCSTRIVLKARTSLPVCVTVSKVTKSKPTAGGVQERRGKTKKD